MADEKVNVGPEGSNPPEAPAASWPGDPLTPEHTEGPLFLAGIRRPLLMRSLPRRSSLLSLVWVGMLPRRPAR